MRKSLKALIFRTAVTLTFFPICGKIMIHLKLLNGNFVEKLFSSMALIIAFSLLFMYICACICKEKTYRNTLQMVNSWPG